MTEAEWLACTDPRPMLEHLGGSATDRKLRLFACACCRRVRHLLADERSPWSVEVAERFADGLATPDDLLESFQCGWGVKQELEREGDEPGWDDVAYCAASAVAEVCNSPDDEEVSYQTRVVEIASWVQDTGSLNGAQACDLLREVFGNPFRRLSVSAACRTADVTAIAQAAYDQRELPSGTLDTASLAVLADALEDAGCADAELVGHLRGPGPHVRGCWALDLLLGKG